MTELAGIQIHHYDQNFNPEEEYMISPQKFYAIALLNEEKSSNGCFTKNFRTSVKAMRSHHMT